MAQLNIKTTEQGFSLPSQYNEDVWKICQWDIYRKANYYYQSTWHTCSKKTKKNMDFTLCDIPLIREEAKYFLYYLLEEKKVTLRTFAEYAERLQLLFAFVNRKGYSSVLDIDTDDFKKFIGSSLKLVTDNGTTADSSISVPSKKRHRLLLFIDSMKKTISEYLESGKPLYERNVWLAKDILNDSTAGDTHNLIFTDIVQPKMKQAVKDFIKDRLSSITIATAYVNLYNIKIFCRWLHEYDESISSFMDVTRDILEDYFTFLRVESDFSQNMVNANILTLSQMFTYGIVYSHPEFPQKAMFLRDDWYFKTKRAAVFYTDEEVKSLFSLLPYIPKIYGRILLVLHNTGLRISEVLKLPINALRFTNDGKPYLLIYMYKTERCNRIPIDEHVQKLIEQETAYTKKKYPDAKYVFVNNNGCAINYHTFTQNIKREIVRHDIHGSDGQLLEFKTHRFRATKATNLINMGLEPSVVADMLGHKNLTSLTYYVTAKEQSLNEQMQEYLRKESILINSIGKMDEAVIQDYENAHPLCNGFCCRPTDLGVCEKLNACLTCNLFRPTIQHMTSYKLQLVEAEASLAMAKENNFKRMVEQCEKEIAALQKIIKGLEGYG